MPAIASSHRHVNHRCVRSARSAGQPHARRRSHSVHGSRCRAAATNPDRLGGYRDGCGRERELVALGACGGSLLIVDRDAATLGDRRLVAHLDAGEPAGNAALVCDSYLSNPSGRWCRRLRAEDLVAIPSGEGDHAAGEGDHAGESDHADVGASRSIEAGGRVHRLRPIAGMGCTIELRWCRRRHGCTAGGWEPVSLREMIGEIESYEPARAVTVAAIAGHRCDPKVSLRRLRGEYRWLCTSPVVLNRALREAVLRAIDRDELSLSEIALRCGAVKRDRRGRLSGETSWLARRVGLMPEGGERRITPWIHSDVLALIAREGLRVSPREVEVL